MAQSSSVSPGVRPEAETEVATPANNSGALPPLERVNLLPIAAERFSRSALPRFAPTNRPGVVMLESRVAVGGVTASNGPSSS